MKKETKAKNKEEKKDKEKVPEESESSEEEIIEEKIIIKADEKDSPKEEELVEDDEKIPEKEKQIEIDDSWKPVTEAGRLVKERKINDIDQLLDYGKPILEKEVVEVLLPNLETDLLLIGQAKGKFGGGKRRVFRQTQKKTREGNKPHFSTYAVVGNKDGYVGVGYGKAKETVPAREKALRKAKLNIMKITRGCGSWQCGCGTAHTIPFKVTGKCGSVEITLMPAPKGKGLCVEKECQKILGLAGIKDVWSKTRGKTRQKTNLIVACMKALSQLHETKVRAEDYKNLSIIEGKLKEIETAALEE